MSLKSSAASFCKAALTVAGLSIVAVIAVPSQVLSLPGINIPSIPSVPNIPGEIRDILDGDDDQKKPEKPEKNNNDNSNNNSTNTNNTTNTTESISESEKRFNENVLIDNTLRVTYKGVRYSAFTSTWNYKLEAPSERELGYVILELPDCVEVYSSSPQGEFVKKDFETRMRGIKWQLGKGPLRGDFSVTVKKKYKVGTLNVAMKALAIRKGTIPGPSCEIHE